MKNLESYWDYLRYKRLYQTIIIVGIILMVSSFNLVYLGRENIKVKVEKKDMISTNSVNETAVMPANIPLVGVHKGEIDDGIPIEIRTVADVCGIEYGVCPELLEAIAWHESRCRYEVISVNGNYYGLMQIHPGSHRNRMKKLGVTTETLLDPYNNMRVAADYLSELIMTYGSVEVALMCYHGEGNGAISRFYTSGKVSSYVSGILKMTEDLEVAHGKIVITED